MQISGTKTVITKSHPSKPKREINNIINSQNTKRTYGQPSEQLFPNRWPLRNRNRTKNNMFTQKVKRHRNSDTRHRQQRTNSLSYLMFVHVKSMQRSGTEAIRTQFQPSKPKREITNTTNSQNTKENICSTE